MRYTLLFLLCGCISVASKKQELPPTPIDTVPIQVQPNNGTERESIVVAKVPDSLFSLIKQYLPTDNKITLQNQIVIDQPEGKITLPSGSSLSYAPSENEILFTFNSPKPILEIVEFGLKIHPTINRVVLHPDDSGVATGQWMGFEKNKTFNLHWTDKVTFSPVEVQEDVGISPQKPQVDELSVESIEQKKSTAIPWLVDDRPELWVYGYSDIVLEKSAPFKLINKGDVAPEWLSSSIKTFPVYYWSIDTLSPMGAKNCKLVQGSITYKQLLSLWIKSHEVEIETLKKPTVATEPKIRFGNPWYQIDNQGRQHATSKIHLLNDHHAPKWLIDKYGNDQNALDRIHGAYHEFGSPF